MAAATHIDVPFFLFENAINNISLEAVAQAAEKYDPNDPFVRQLQIRVQTQLNNIGTLYKAIFETHQQRSRIDRGSIDYSPFGLDYYEGYPFDRFRSEFGATCAEWPTPANRHRGWLSSYIRNSIAHNTTSVRLQAGYLGVTVANSRDGIAPNFELWMTVKDYVRLIARSVKDHTDGCLTCAHYTERQRDASRNLKLFLEALTGLRQGERGQVRVNQFLNMPA